jgi:hypothetical protein
MAQLKEFIKTSNNATTGFTIINVTDGEGINEVIKKGNGLNTYHHLAHTEITTTKNNEGNVISTTIVDRKGYKEIIKTGTGVNAYNRIIHPFYINKISGGGGSDYDFTGKTLYLAGESTATGFGLSGGTQTENDFNNSWPFLIADSLGMDKTHIGYPGATCFNWLDINGNNNIDPTTISVNSDAEVYSMFYTQTWRLFKPLNALTSVREDIDGILTIMIGGNDSLIQSTYGTDVTTISPYTTQYCINNASSFNVSSQYAPNYSGSAQACFFWCLKKIKTQLPNLKIIIVQTNALQNTSNAGFTRMIEMLEAFSVFFNTTYGQVYYIPYSEGGTQLGQALTSNYLNSSSGHPNQLWNNAMRDWLVPKIQTLAADW